MDEKIRQTLDYMIADQKKKGNVMMVAFYIRPE
jgi:hypothetical protein